MADYAKAKYLAGKSLETRLRLLKLCNRTVIHIGGDLSCCDLMTLIWQHLIRYDVESPRWEDRDRFVLSKGHGAAVTSFSQAAIGCYNVEDIYREYASDFGRFGMHSCNLENPYVDVSTGSLGHGFPIAVGMAAQLRAKKSKSYVYTVVGDGECGEGSIWEGAMAAAHYKLGNLVVFVDRNGLSFDGPTEENMALEPFADKWKAFGWNVLQVKDGNDMEQLLDAAEQIPGVESRKPTVLICNTVKGCGISFMENEPGWHAGKISDEDLEVAEKELRNAYRERWGED